MSRGRPNVPGVPQPRARSAEGAYRGAGIDSCGVAISKRDRTRAPRSRIYVRLSERVTRLLRARIRLRLSALLWRRAVVRGVRLIVTGECRRDCRGDEAAAQQESK